MFKDKTLFIVGAGASHDFGLPIGADLVTSIKYAALFNRSEIIKLNEIAHNTELLTDESILKKHGKSQRPAYISAGQALYDHLLTARSIDDFLERHANHPDVIDLAKLFIVQLIANAEHASKLYYDPTVDTKLNMETLSNTWALEFAKTLIGGVKESSIANIGKSIDFICFNYDRCLERLLTEIIFQSYISLSYNEAHEIVDSMHILHPYGYLGSLPNRSTNAQNQRIQFGARPRTEFDPWAAATGIKTYSEQIEDEKILAEIRDSVAESKQIIFLGFGFLPENIKVLTANKEQRRLPTTYATGYGISEAERGVITSAVSKIRPQPLNTFNRFDSYFHLAIGKTCRELFMEYGRNFVAG